MDSESRLVAPGAAAGERAGLVRGAGSQLRDEGAPGGQRRAAGLQVVENGSWVFSGTRRSLCEGVERLLTDRKCSLCSVYVYQVVTRYIRD